ncbi:MAG TPA: hypothetical protein VJK00_13970 [Steroidobacteraceae bacterium]|nr:hypothetical protein [Steroidobacteraceae bacterium]
MAAPTPLLDLFKRGEVDRDVRMQAAAGALAPRAHEQLAILVLLLEDRDPEIRVTADETLGKIPESSLRAFLARSDVAVDLREFFADRGIFPDEIPQIEFEEEVDEPLIDTDPVGALDDDSEEARQSGVQALVTMTFPQRLKAAMKGSREVRAVLIRDPNKLIASSVLSSPKVSIPEVESFARMQNVSEDVLRIIAANRGWLKSYGIVLALTKNPKTPLSMSMNLMARLTSKDLQKLAVDRNVPEALRISARKKVVQSSSGKS